MHKRSNENTGFLYSNGLPIPFTPAYFQRIQPSEVANENALRKQYQENGFVYLKSVLDEKSVFNLREAYFKLFDQVIFKEGSAIKDGIFSGTLQYLPSAHGHKDHPASRFVLTDEFEHFTHSKALYSIAATLLGEDVVQLKCKPLRHFYKGTEVASQAHTDYTYMDDGTDKLLSIWIPLGEIYRWPVAAYYT